MSCHASLLSPSAPPSPVLISSGRLAQMVRKWQRAVAEKKRIDAALVLDSEVRGAAAPAGKGHFVVYSGDGQHFEVPLSYLESDIFTELLRMSEEVFD
ncbi:hypothetical protein Taro_012082 [Colocasia esculenta]|uniref:Uncharacterized protein n=1 Tax=Colocasia esculenta TaxID=4460 RepID=A0A843U7R7_COLES|nr:hypothetical protein [Colocasia esculenta]